MKSTCTMFATIVAGLFGCQIYWTVSLAQNGGGGDLVEEGGATVITSEKLTFDYKRNHAVFEENVVVLDPGMELTADKLAAWFNEDGDGQLIKAEGRVRIIQDDKMATAGEAVYDLANDKITLTDGPRLQRGKHFLEGQTITYWRKQELLVCEPQSHLVIFPDEDSTPINFLGD